MGRYSAENVAPVEQNARSQPGSRTDLESGRGGKVALGEVERKEQVGLEHAGRRDVEKIKGTVTSAETVAGGKALGLCKHLRLARPGDLQHSGF